MNVIKNFVSVAILSCFLVGCGSSKAPLSAQGEKEVLVPCSGVEFVSTPDFMRASDMAISTSLSLSKKKALLSAKSKLASNIKSTIKKVADDYYVSYQKEEMEDSKRRFEDMTRTIVDQQLSNVRIICDKTTKADDGMYRSYVAVEMSLSELMSKLNAKISMDDKDDLDFNYDKFKELFEKRVATTK
ncbi:MAG: hypothetical protein WCQ82_04295 [Bacteroidaceae bacterium]|nr:hypothetical protein [Bacteroidaceae bacterium]